jgi:hypothetical protein
MTEQRFTYYDANGVRRTLIHDDENPERTIVQTEQVMDEILAGAARMRDTPQPGAIKKIATVPIEVYERSVLEDWDDDDWKKFLNDPDNVALRTWKGQI